MKMFGNAPAAQSLDDSASFRTKPIVAFIGTCLDFPSACLDVVRNDMEGILVERFASLRDLREKSASGGHSVHALILSEDRADDLVARLDAYELAAGTGRIVLAYKSVAIAKALRLRGLRMSLSFMPVNCSIDVWTAFMRLICKGEEVVPGELIDTQVPAAPTGPPPPGNTAPGDKTDTGTLTPRETQIIELVAKGMTNRAIARSLSLSEHTVKLHLHNTYSKLGVSNRASAAALHLYGTRHAGQ